MKSEIKIKRTIIHSDYSQLQTNLIDGTLRLNFADRGSDDWVRFYLGEDDIQIMLGMLLLNDPNPIPKLHALFRYYKRLHSLLTESMLTFDTEAGGQTMNLEAASAEKEEQP